MAAIILQIILLLKGSPTTLALKLMLHLMQGLAVKLAKSWLMSHPLTHLISRCIN